MKKSRTYSRRQQALFAVALLAAAVVLSQLLGLIALLPGQVVRENELSNGLPAMEIFYSADGGEAPMRGKRLYLSRSGDTLLYSVAQFTPLGGWYPMFNGTVLDLREGGCAAYHCVSRGETGWLCLFGFVPEGEEPPSFTLTVTGLEEAAFYSETFTPAAEIPTAGGACFLLTATYPLPAEERGRQVRVEPEGGGFLPYTSTALLH